MILGLTGSHRVGKTSLARAYAEKHGVQFIETSTSKVWLENGLDPSAPHPFAVRLATQEKVLDSLIKSYEAVDLKRGAITDRTPIDLIGYTLGEAVGHVVADGQQEQLADYIDRCYRVASKYLSGVLLIQPGIPLVDAPGKGAFNVAWIEHLTHLMRGLGADTRLKIPFYTLQRDVIAMDRRLTALESTVKSVTAKAEKELLDLLENRRKTH